MSLVELFVRVLVDHQLGFMGTCVTATGSPGCAWKPRRDVVRHGGYGAQHRQHQAEVLAVAASPSAPRHQPVPATEQAVIA